MVRCNGYSYWPRALLPDAFACIKVWQVLVVTCMHTVSILWPSFASLDHHQILEPMLLLAYWLVRYEQSQDSDQYWAWLSL